MKIINKLWLLEEFESLEYHDMEDIYHAFIESNAELFANRLYEFSKIEYLVEDMDYIIKGGWRGKEELDSRRETTLERVLWAQSEASRFLKNYEI